MVPRWFGGLVVPAAAFALLAAAAGFAAAQMSVPPAEYRPLRPAKAEAAPRLLLAPGAPARRVALLPPTAAESALLQPRNAASAADAKPRNKRARVAIGFPRAIPAAAAAYRLADLPWQVAASGERAVQIAFTSPDAQALRLGLTLVDAPAGLTLRFQGSAARAAAFGPYTATEVASEAMYWSPVLEGSTATVELALPPGVDAGAAQLLVPQVSHLAVAGPNLRAVVDGQLGQSGACEVDIACVAPALQQQLSSATNAVARLLVTMGGSTFICTGTLLNDSINSFTPWFLTADHCLEDTENPALGRGSAAAAASTINTYWFFQAATCGSIAMPDSVVVAGGAKLLARSVDYDWALVKLNVQPPSGTTFAAWNAEGPIATGTPIDGIHHPAGDLKKLSRGVTLPYRTFSDGASYIEVLWDSGVTEGGSSGSGLFTLNAAANYFELRGTLTGGESLCSNPKGTDYYGRYDVAFPLVAQYVAPTAANPAKTTAVIEYYSAGQDAYFITADPFEIAGRDKGVPAGWVRTGYRFLAYTDPAVAPAGVQPVCRLYSPAPYGNARFYSASQQECAAMLAQAGGHWIQESAAAFYIGVPAGGRAACAADTRPIYRFLDTLHPPARRYTAEVDLRDSLVATGKWQQEGYGAGTGAAMCAPLAGATTPPPAIANYQGLWWNAPAGSESGWGINFAHQGDTLFATWFTFDADGKPLWMVVAAPKIAANTYAGTLYRGTGPAFNATPFDPQRVVGTIAGSATFTFTNPDNATFAYDVGGIAQTKNITRQFFASPVPQCSFGTQHDPAGATNYQDIWWNAPAGSESGWGINFTHQGDTIFATWFTFDLDGKPMWLAVSAARVAPDTYTGSLYTGTGPAFSAVPFDSAKVLPLPVGTATLTFADGNSATFAYTVNGIAQTKTITREIFNPPGTVCY